MKCKSICPGGKLIRGKLSRTILAASCGLGLAFCTASVRLEAVPAHSTGTTRTYYVAADEVQWDYTPSGRDEAMGMDFDEIGKAFTQSGPHRIGHVYKKAMYREYTDAGFTHLKPRSPEDQYLGILGPILRGAVGDTIKVVFRNNGSHPYSMHPHGVLYLKDSEGADLRLANPRSIRPGAKRSQLDLLALPLPCRRTARCGLRPVWSNRRYAAR
jgi:hypothetical protein